MPVFLLTVVDELSTLRTVFNPAMILFLEGNMPTTMTLPPKFSGRLEKLALEAGSTPEKMLDYVMRDGFEYTEHFVSEVKKGIADADAGRIVPHEEAMIRLQATIKKHAQKQKAA